MFLTGQSTNYLATCMDTLAVPFVIDVDHTNKTQRLFGMERFYLRNHYTDNSYMREWSIHRMLARFGLPHLRARKVRLFLNGIYHGLYTLMEAEEQEYVFARSFPSYDPDNYALFKVKSLSIGCGAYSEQQLEQARRRINETSTPPYLYEHGDHRERVPVLGPTALDVCHDVLFYGMIEKEADDAALAYLRYDEDCGKMLVQEGLIDQDLGQDSWEVTMEGFIRNHLAAFQCEPQCTNSNLTADVNVDNFLKSFAAYAVLILQDSPMGNGNNYYLGNGGDGLRWNMVQFDHNSAGTGFSCSDECTGKEVYWSIIRPTCQAIEKNQLVGPLLTNETLHAKYIEYLRSFVDTILRNQSFIDEMMNHGQAIESYVPSDFWSTRGYYFPFEKTPNASLWNISTRPFLPFLAARTKEVLQQLEALDSGTFPRGPHLDTPVESDELCVDWRSESKNVSAQPTSAAGLCYVGLGWSAVAWLLWLWT